MKFTPDCRDLASSAVLTDSDDRELLIIAGGRDTDDKNLNSVEAFDGIKWDNNYFEYPPKHFSAYANCLVKINSSVLLFIGETRVYVPEVVFDHGMVNTYFFIAHENKWIPGPSIKMETGDLSCGLLTSKNPDTNKVEKVIVAIVNLPTSSSVELLFLDEDGSNKEEWVAGPELPVHARGSRIIEFQVSISSTFYARLLRT